MPSAHMAGFRVSNSFHHYSEKVQNLPFNISGVTVVPGFFPWESMPASAPPKNLMIDFKMRLQKTSPQNARPWSRKHTLRLFPNSGLRTTSKQELRLIDLAPYRCMFRARPIGRPTFKV